MRVARLLACMLCTIAPPARADELSLAEAPGSMCPEIDLRGEVEAALGRPLAPGEPVLRARVAMHRRGRRVRIVLGLERDGASTERTLEAASCEGAARAAGLVLALALDPELGLRADEPPPPPETTHDVAPETQGELPESQPELQIAIEGSVLPEPDPAPEHVASPRVSLAPAITARALVDGGSLPGVNGGASLGGGLVAGLGAIELAIELEASYLAAARAIAPEPGASVELVLAYGTLRAGLMVPVVPILALGAAAELDVGAAGGAGMGARVQSGSSQLLAWASLRGALLVEVRPVASVGMRVMGSIGTPLSAPSFEIAGLGSVFSPSGVLVQGALGLVVRIP